MLLTYINKWGGVNDELLFKFVKNKISSRIIQATKKLLSFVKTKKYTNYETQKNSLRCFFYLRKRGIDKMEK